MLYHLQHCTFLSFTFFLTAFAAALLYLTLLPYSFMYCVFCIKGYSRLLNQLPSADQRRVHSIGSNWQRASKAAKLQNFTCCLAKEKKTSTARTLNLNCGWFFFWFLFLCTEVLLFGQNIVWKIRLCFYVY